MQNLSIGIDIIEIERFKKLQNRKSFLEKIFTSKEREICSRKQNPIQSLAVRFAAKEAVKKTIPENIEYNVIEITNDKNGKPDVIILEKEIKEKYTFDISLSHTEMYAAAVCLTVLRYIDENRG